MRELVWKVIAWVVSRSPVVGALFWLAKKRPYTHLHGKDGSPYMMRWWLFNPYEWPSGSGKRAAWREWLPSVRLHWIQRPDHDRHLHDHPWNARTIILVGFYLEQTETGHVAVRTRGDTARLLFGQYHRIVSVNGAGTLTLFITWGYRGTWGFLVDGKKVPWRTYLGLTE